jgi:phage baseplate assembly protein W
MPTYFRGFSTVDANQNNNKLYDIELIKRDLLNHFYTRRGERVMYPEYGSIIWDLIFEPLTDYNKDTIINDCLRIVGSDTRVNLQNVNVTSYTYGIRLRIDLLYVPYNAVGTFDVDFDRRSQERN